MCTAQMRHFLTMSPGLVFSAPLSAYHAGAAMKAFEIIDKTPSIV